MLSLRFVSSSGIIAQKLYLGRIKRLKMEFNVVFLFDSV